MPGRYWHLKHNEVLAALSVDELRRLEARSRTKSFTAGSPIYLPSDLADGVLLLTEGRVRICNTSEEGKRAILAYIDPGELFGELSLLGDVVRDELAEAVERSQVILMPRDEIQRVMQDNARLTLGITKLVGLRRQRIERRLKSLLFRSVGQRLADLLLELAERYGKETATGVVIDLRLSHQEMASAIGSTRESVTLLLGEWTTAGIVAKQRNRVTILSLERLRRLVENVPSSGARQPPVATKLRG